MSHTLLYEVAVIVVLNIAGLEGERYRITVSEAGI